MLHLVYRGLTRLATPGVRLLLARRLKRGKEDPQRLPERLGHAGRTRPPGRLVWLHAASVGESQSLLVLLGRLLERDPGLSAVVTTGTVTSAALMARRLPARAWHQYVPVDLPQAAARFLDHWRPDLVLWAESELWPNLLDAVHRRGLPAALVNARMSERSFRGWQRAPRFAARLLDSFAVALAQSEADAARLRRLGARAVTVTGNLKYSADPLPADPAELQRLGALLQGRPVWLLASSHEGEEQLAAEAHRVLAPRHPHLLTIIVPRHPERGPKLADSLGMPVALRSRGELPGAGTALYLADTLGELGLFYRLCPVTVIGKSLCASGGQNPVEPAQLGSAVVMGPEMGNFADIAAELEQGGGALRLAAAGDLKAALDRLLSNPEQCLRLGQAGRAVAGRNQAVVERVLAGLEPLLARMADRPGAAA
jgi:3-deoxy-D-manno-octulosonic-acid transferase